MKQKEIGRTFQTLTDDEQSEILDHLHKAQQIIFHSKCSNMAQDLLLRKLADLFHDVQLANTQEL